MKKRGSDISSVFASQFRDFEAQPDRDLWAAIEAEIAPEVVPVVPVETPQKAPRAWFPWLAGAAAACATLVLGWYLGQQAPAHAPMAQTAPQANAWQPSLEPLALAPVQPVAVMESDLQAQEAETLIPAQKRIIAHESIASEVATVETSAPSARPITVENLTYTPTAALALQELNPQEIPAVSVASMSPALDAPQIKGTRTVLALDEPDPNEFGAFLVKKVSQNPNSPIKVETVDKGNKRIRRMNMRLFAGVQIRRTTHTEIITASTP